MAFVVVGGGGSGGGGGGSGGGGGGKQTCGCCGRYCFRRFDFWVFVVVVLF